MRMLVALLSRAIGARVVLVAIDIAAHRVLLVIDLGAFALGQMAAICRSIVTHFLVDVRFLVFEVAGFARRQLTRSNALPNASLLVALTLVHAAIRCVRRTAVIFGREVCMVEARTMFVRDL